MSSSDFERIREEISSVHIPSDITKKQLENMRFEEPLTYIARFGRSLKPPNSDLAEIINVALQKLDENSSQNLILSCFSLKSKAVIEFLEENTRGSENKEILSKLIFKFIERTFGGYYNVQVPPREILESLFHFYCTLNGIESDVWLIYHLLVKQRNYLIDVLVSNISGHFREIYEQFGRKFDEGSILTEEARVFAEELDTAAAAAEAAAAAAAS